MFTCSGTAIATTDSATFTSTDYENVISAVIAAYDAETAGQDQTDWAGCVLRLAGHDLMDYNVDDPSTLGGSDGCLSFSDPANFGLRECLTGSSILTVYDGVCDTVSLADFITWSGEAVAGRTHASYDAVDPWHDDGLLWNFRNITTVGRTTADTCAFVAGRLPNPENSCDDLEAVFVDHVFKN